MSSDKKDARWELAISRFESNGFDWDALDPDVRAAALSSASAEMDERCANSTEKQFWDWVTNLASKWRERSGGESDYPREPNDGVEVPDIPLIVLRATLLGCSTTLGVMVESAKSWQPIRGVEQLTVREARDLITECDNRLADIDKIKIAIINVKRELKL